MKRKIKTPLFGLAAVSFALNAGADEDVSRTIPSITVTAQAPVSDGVATDDLLRAQPGMVVLSQGGSQTDLSIRGSTFSAAGLSLGGIALRNPQTEHFHAELPLPVAMLARPVVQTGLANQGGHLTGTAGFDLRPMVRPVRRVEAGFGSDHRDMQHVLVQQPVKGPVGIGVFAGRESARGVDYSDNDLQREYGGGHLQFSDFDRQVDLVVAHQRKSFGARGYYGVVDTLPAHEKTEDTMVLVSGRKGDTEYDYLRAGAAWREFRDVYQLPTIGFRNDHRSRISSAFFDGRTIEVNRWALGWRTDVEEERVASRGTTGGLGYHHRNRVGLSLLPRWRGERLTLTPGGRVDYLSRESTWFLPQLGAEWSMTDQLTAFAAYTEAVRPPSYTELNYNSPGSLGNAGLRPQTEQQTEIGVKGVPSAEMDWTVTLFHRRTKRTVDWMKETAAGRWEATDIGTLNTVGCEAVLGWYPSRDLDVQTGYTWLHKNRRPGDFGRISSRYALDYPEHRVMASVRWRPVSSLEIGAMQSLHRQTDNALRRSGRIGTESAVTASYTLPPAPYATISLHLRNVWDDDFETFPGQRVAGSYAGITLALAW